ncbi:MULTISPECIES: hypothetical protein [Bacillus cereus group]|uniref:hypothetical protein n=1 Tax=Bacillus cereus group TaxID=86661 RepID=UPI000BF41DD4|nr:hypothetical protein CN339_28795 [Bacillus thuringiensis]
MYKNLLNFLLYCILNTFMYLTIYFIAIKPAIITATSIDYNRMQFIFLLLVLILISMIYGLIMRKLIRHNSGSSGSIVNESLIFIFSHVFTALILFFIILI